MIKCKGSDVELNEEPHRSFTTCQRSIEYFLKEGKIEGSKFETCSDREKPLQGTGTMFHPFVGASHEAYDKHRALILSPDILWNVIAQGLSTHINKNSEKMRSVFVNFDGKVEIEIRDASLVKGSHNNCWESVFHKFSSEIKKHIGEENHENLVVDFSTTTEKEKTVNEVLLMDSMKSFFDYTVTTMCGIPHVYLEGTEEDYVKIAKKLNNACEKYDMPWWSKALTPVVERIANCASGKEDEELWDNWYKISGGSGGQYISGYVIKFFPYMRDYNDNIVRNEWLHKETDNNPFGMSGVTNSEFLGSLSSVPFKWNYYEKIYNMSLLAGFNGIEHIEDKKAVKPHLAWAIVEK